MFICTGITPSVAVDTVKKPTMPISNGKTLYVGGTGYGNYTSIQDAIDDASNGDTVFVYMFSAPYSEIKITIEKSINLIGENKNFTIIKDTAIYVWCDYVVISNFTIINDFPINDASGISVRYGCGDFSCFSNNIIKNSYIAIDINGVSKSLTISHNKLENGKYGISLEGSSNSTVSNNIIKKFKYGIYIDSDIGPNNTIIHNQCEENDIGLYIELATDSGKVMQNNFINNKRNIKFFIEHPIRRLRLRLLNPVFTNNYYDTWLGKGPKWIIGRAIIFYIPFYFPLLYTVLLIPILIIPWIKFDWHPAKEPYNIEGVI